MRISRHYSDHHVNEDIFEMCLVVYEDQTRGWFHDQARILEKASDHAGFVLLLIAVSYIESYAVFWKGKDSRNRSQEFFRDAFQGYFSNRSREFSNLRSHISCKILLWFVEFHLLHIVVVTS